MIMQDHLDFINKNYLAQYSIKELANAVLQLQRGLTGDRKLIKSSYMDEQLFLCAYLAYYWPVSYMQMEHSLREISNIATRQISKTNKAKTTISILDYGSGPGPMSVAVLDYLGNLPQHPSSVTCLLADMSQCALEKARGIIKTGAYPFTISIRTIHTHTLSECSTNDANFDYILFGHSLNEIMTGSAHGPSEIRSFLQTSLDPEGLAIFIEPSLLATSRNLIALRNYLVENDDFSCLAPCPNTTTCTVLEAGTSHTCHDTLLREIPELPAAIAKMLGLNRENIKMTWFAFLKLPRRIEADIYRVVSDPMLNKAGRVRYIVCGSRGRISLSAHKADSHAQQIGFFSLTRGDIFAITKAELRENGLGIQDSTEITLYTTLQN